MLNQNEPVIFPRSLISILGIAYLTVLFSAGFITNFIPLMATNTGTVVLYGLSCALIVAAIPYLFYPMSKSVGLAVFLVLSLSCLIVLKAFADSNSMSQRAQELLIFFLGALPFLFFIQMRDQRIRQQFSSILSYGLFGLSVLSIIQSALADHLPMSLFVLRGDNTFSVDEDKIFRPTGLTGNPIIFSSILVFASAYFAAMWLEKRKLRFLLGLICSLIGNYVTYTRSSIVLVIPVLLLVWLFHVRFQIKHKLYAVIAAVLLAAAGPSLLAIGANLVIIQRLQNSDASSLESTLIHFEQIKNAGDAILAHPYVGVGMGSQGDFVGPENVIVTDGAWWILLLEFGIPLSLLLLISLCALLFVLGKAVLRRSTDRSLAVATLAFHAYIIPASVINSALLGHISFGLYWVALGLSLADIDQLGSLSTNLLHPRMKAGESVKRFSVSREPA